MESSVVEQLHKLLSPLMLRRLKADVETELPPKKELRIFCGTSAMQRVLVCSALGQSLHLSAALVQADHARRLGLVALCDQQPPEAT
jgi:SNF2 family DNA or RNA helicase